MNIVWSAKKFDDLTVQELYAVLQLRCEVFAVEQKIVYQDCDDYDQKAVHLMGWQGDKLVAYARLFAPGIKYPEAAMGRFVTSPIVRGKRVGHQLITRALQEVETRFDKAPMTISAQQYLEKFYQSYGFVTTGSPYIEEDIPHIKMTRPGGVSHVHAA